MRNSFTITEVPLCFCNTISVGEFCLSCIYEYFLERFSCRDFYCICCELFIKVDNIFEFWLSYFYYCLIFETDNISESSTIFAGRIDGEIDCKCSLIFKFIIYCLSSSQDTWAIWCTEPPSKIGIWYDRTAGVDNILSL